MTNDILEINVKKTIQCSKEVAFWNYWDHEHLDVVHSGYKKSDILYDKENYLFRVDLIKIPFIPFFKFTTPIFMVQHDKNKLLTFAIQFGVISKTTITIRSLETSKSEITMNYKFYLNGWRKILKPILKRLIPIWNEKVWKEDYSVKIRRQKILDMNFRDFIGLPDLIKDRISNGETKELKLPIPRPKNSTRDRHPIK
jgi:hypothetical protein